MGARYTAAEAAALERQALANGGSVRATPVRGTGESPVASRSAQIDETSPELFLPACKLHGLSRPVPEHRFHPDRKWRFDYAWLKLKVALEIDGGAYSQGRHTRGKGFIKDQEKRNEALLLGWKVFHCVPQDVKDGSVFELLKRALAP